MPASPNDRTILHADMDAFYAAVEQRDCPELRGLPVIVGGLGRRGVVSTASYEAREFGVHSAMPMARARELCPHGNFVRGRMEVYAGVSQQIRGVFEEFTPLIEPLSLDEAFLDVTGSVDLFGDGQAIAEKIRTLVKERTGLTISVGVATSKFVAKVASDLDKPDGLTVVVPGSEAEFLHGLPVARLWGAGPRMQKRLTDLSYHKIGDLQDLDLPRSIELMGESLGEHFYHLCRGIDDRPVEPDREIKSISHEETFEHDLRTREDCYAVLLDQSERVGRRLRRQDLRGWVVRLKLRDPDFTTCSRQRRLGDATDDDLTIYRQVRSLFDEVRAEMAPVRLLGVAVADLLPRGAPAQGGLFDRELDQKSDQLNTAMDCIRDRFGEGSIWHGR
ncbi:MAG: DNA polymerase IV [Planctomycetota bacterium]|nr:DNA polymerase IV [Planctomycetota bacterium]